MVDDSVSDYLYDWGSYQLKGTTVKIWETTLRDGLQAPYIRQPRADEKIALVEEMIKLGIDVIEIGFPASGPHHYQDIVSLARYLKETEAPVKVACAARTVIGDVERVVEVAKEVDSPIEVLLIAGSSKIRHYVEDWSLRQLGGWIRDSIRLAIDSGLSVNFIAEDVSRAEPKLFDYIYKTAIEEGATTLSIADTVGCATPQTVANLVKYLRNNVVKHEPVEIDFHGHDDRGLAVANSMAAVVAGVDKVHVTALGIGERAGNTPAEPLLLNLKIEKARKKSLKNLIKYSEIASEIFHLPLRENYPGVGKMVFTTAVGMHAAAMLKAKKMGRDDLADIVYCGVEPKMFGSQSRVLIGPLSGLSNIEWYLERKGIKVNKETMEAILAEAKTLERILTETDVLRILTKLKIIS